ncbi:MAG: hypothetical protein Q7R86_01545 [bacterium]|nr:hypothetical protein [bacterium]
MASIGENKIDLVKKLYYKDLLSMSQVARRLGVSLEAVIYFMRRNGLYRRSYLEANNNLFRQKIPSFRVRANNSFLAKELEIAGVMLYWAEGYKSVNSTFVDLANSDPKMIEVFLNFLRKTYEVDERKFRVLLYCYADQDVRKLTSFWSSITRISKSQFTKPYVRKDFRKNGRKMENGMIHVRYIDKKLLLDIKERIAKYVRKFAQVDP